MSSIYLPTPIYTALESKRLNEFTVVECLKAGYGEEHTSYTNAAGYGFVYLQLVKLVNKGLLSRESSGRKLIFVKTSEYYNVNILECTSRESEISPLMMDLLLQLNERYSHYEGEMQILWGKKGECDELTHMHPQLEEVISHVAKQTDEKINAVLGRIKGVKAIIDAVTS